MFSTRYFEDCKQRLIEPSIFFWCVLDDTEEENFCVFVVSLKDQPTRDIIFASFSKNYVFFNELNSDFQDSISVTTFYRMKKYVLS